MHREAKERSTSRESRDAIRDEKLMRLIVYLERLHAHSFTGNIRVNLTQGRIGRIEKYEEILK